MGMDALCRQKTVLQRTKLDMISTELRRRHDLVRFDTEDVRALARDGLPRYFSKELANLQR